MEGKLWKANFGRQASHRLQKPKIQPYPNIVKQAGQQERALANCNLMQVICSTTNIRRAYKRVKQNTGAAGIAKWRWVNLQTGLRTKGGESHQILKPVRKFTSTTGDEQELV